MILFGGENEHQRKLYDDTWAYHLETNTWTELDPDAPPSERGWHAMAYSTAAGQIVLFGGGPSRQQYTDETWIYNPAANTWTNIPPDL